MYPTTHLHLAFSVILAFLNNDDIFCFGYPIILFCKRTNYYLLGKSYLANMFGSEKSDGPRRCSSEYSQEAEERSQHSSHSGHWADKITTKKGHRVLKKVNSVPCHSVNTVFLIEIAVEKCSLSPRG